MADPVSQFATRIAYGARQLPRLAWYAGHGLAMRRLAAEARRRASAEPGSRARDRANRCRAATGCTPTWRALLRQDLANVEAGIYPLPADHDGSLRAAPPLAAVLRGPARGPSPPRARRPQRSADRRDPRQAAPLLSPELPFPVGRLDDGRSAQRYDTQVEVLFGGTANAMRRQALPPLHEVFAGRDQRRLRLLDVGCGTGRFLDFVKQAWPRLSGARPRSVRSVHARGEASLARWSWTSSSSPMPRRSRPDESQDAVTSMFMFHELPPEVRRIVFRRVRPRAETGRAPRAGGFAPERR